MKEEPDIDFNRGWQFVKSDAQWPDDFDEQALEMKPVILPHTWNADDMVVGERDPYVGSGWYLKIFDTPDLAPGQRLLLEFEGATNCLKVWINGGYAGGRDGGFLPTMLDITDFLEAGENTVRARVDNSYDVLAAMPRNIDWNRYGGMTRPVWMHIRDHAYLIRAGVEVETPEVSETSARTVIRTHVQEERLSGGNLDIRHSLTDPDGQVIATTTTAITTSYGRTHTVEAELPVVDRPQLWSDATPRLYTLLTELLEDETVIDQREDRIGYRFFTFDADQGFLLNGKPTQLRGANIHIFFPGLGNALPERFHRSDMELMKRMGCNYMRTSHYPRPKACLDTCDELGILVLEEQPYWHGSLRAFGGETAINNAPRLIRDMVRHHRNHPSIIAWNTVNEVMLAPAYKPGVGHLEPGDTRRVSWAVNPKEYPYIRRHLQVMVDTFKDVDPGRPVSMVVGGAWRKNEDAGLTSMTDIVAYNGGALNFVDNFTDPETGEAYTFRPDYYRDIHPRRVHLMSEGILNDVCYSRGDWAQEEVAWRNNARYWDAFGERPWFCGGSMWCFTDYSANGDIRLHGAVDRYRLPKDLFYFYEAMWSDHPVLHILGHWNHEPDAVRDIVVFSNCTDIDLTLNGDSLGPGTSSAGEYPHIDHPPLIWKNVAYAPGELKATGRAGKAVFTDVRVTSGEPVGIRLIAANNDLVADGRDICYIDSMLCDAGGNRCHTASALLNIEVSGAARLGGPGEVKIHGGIGRFAIRSNGQTGLITIGIRGKELAPARISLLSR